MRKSLVVAIREYAAAVKTKSFIISVILLPFMMFGGIIAQKLGEKIGDTSTRRVAIIDRTPDAFVYDKLAVDVEVHNSKGVYDASGRQVRAKFAIEKVAPADLSDPSAADRERLELSKRVRSGELLGFVEIGPDLLKPAAAPRPTTAPDDAADLSAVRYSTNRPTYMDFRNLLQGTLSANVIQKRFEIAGLKYDQYRPLLVSPSVTNRGLADQRDGKVTYEQRPAQFASFIV